ncbi:MAG: D-glycero-beta-D-manno-heptose-7-phosphate kinase [Candidatus Omnitrophica bacterium]|nr:D-glycero-beta-D-manno-heptose-7-phosphate kinase [Candidatus Omnitrophota bacterium]
MIIHAQRLKTIFSNFKKSKVLVVGDLILDQFIWGDVSRISPEAPVPVVYVQRESVMPGGAANVASNVRDLGGMPVVVGVIGNDSWGRVLKEKLKRPVDTSGIIVDAARKTSLKTRIVARHQQVVRVDREITEQISKAVSKKIIRKIKKNINRIQAIIIEDYGKGVVNPFLIREIVKLARSRKVIVTVDPKEDHFSYYRGVSCITPNQHEAEKAAGIKIMDNKTLLAAGKKLLKKINSRAVLITRGEQGMCLLEKKKRGIHISTKAQEVFDVSGAGDTVIATFTLALASGATFEEAAHISNYAAGIVVGKVGVATCSLDELLRRIYADGIIK